MPTYHAVHKSPDVHVMWEFTRAEDREDYVEYDSTYRSYAPAPPEGTEFKYEMVLINGLPVRAGFRDLQKDPLPECPSCNGRGEIGGITASDPGGYSEPCPECNALPEPNPDPLRTIYEALPDDVKRKVSCHDLKRICDALFPVAKDRQPPVRGHLLKLIHALDSNESEVFFDTFLELTGMMSHYCEDAEKEAAQSPDLTK